MPPQKSNAANGFLSKYKNTPFAKQVGTAAKKEINYGPEQLPPGLKAVCQISDASLVEFEKDTKMKTADGKSAAGEYYVMFKAVIVEPVYFEHNGRNIKVGGKHTSLIIPCCDTKNGAGKITTQADQCDRIIMEVGKLTSPEYIADATFEMIPQLVEGVKESKPFFNFVTSVKAASADGKYPEGVWENWNGNKGLEDYTPPDPDAPEDNSPAAGGNAVAPTGDEPEDLDALVAAANDADNADHETAKARLIELAEGVGAEIGPETDAPPNTINGAPSWDVVKAWIDAGAVPDLEDPAVTPAKGTVYKYSCLIDPKNVKKGKKAQECEVTVVNEKAQTVTLKNLANKAIYKDVPWTELEAA